MIRDFGIKDVVQVSLYTVIPNAIGAIGLILIARRSDRRNERHGHFLVCTTGGALALAALTLHPSSFAVSLGLLSVAAVLIFAALPIFWSLPPGLLPSQTIAPGIAFISSVGITSGIVSPWLIGLVKTRTGNIDIALYILAVLLLLSGLTMWTMIPRKEAPEGQRQPA